MIIDRISICSLGNIFLIRVPILPEVVWKSKWNFIVHFENDVSAVGSEVADSDRLYQSDLERIFSLTSSS